jgi:protein-tyrosine phosphatase
MIKVCFVCHGNICRSPMAEFVMKHLVREAGFQDKFYIDSAATSTEEIGNGVHYGTRQKLKSVGIPCGEHRARQITKGDYRKFDYIIGMDDWNMRNMLSIFKSDDKNKLYKLSEFCGSDSDIADPWYTGNFDDTYRDIDKGCRALLERCIKQ